MYSMYAVSVLFWWMLLDADIIFFIFLIEQIKVVCVNKAAKGNGRRKNDIQAGVQLLLLDETVVIFQIY